MAIGLLAGAALGAAAFALRSPPQSIVASALPEIFDDLKRATNAAQKQGKDILVEFSAPDTPVAGPRARNATRLDDESIRRTVGEKFVLVRLTCSRTLSLARLAQVTTYAEKFGIARFPAFILLDRIGRAYARSEPATNELYDPVAEFGRLQNVRIHRDRALVLAAGTTGVARARYLDEALTAVGSFADSEYAEIERQVVALDAGNSAGLRSKYESRVAARCADDAVQGEIYPLVDRGQYRAAIVRIDRLLAEIKLPEPQHQLLLAFKGQLYFSLGDRTRAVRFLDDAVALNPRSDAADRIRSARAPLADARLR